MKGEAEGTSQQTIKVTFLLMIKRIRLDDGYPDAPCRKYFPTFPLERGHFSPNVGK